MRNSCRPSVLALNINPNAAMAAAENAHMNGLTKSLMAVSFETKGASRRVASNCRNGHCLLVLGPDVCSLALLGVRPTR